MSGLQEVPTDELLSFQDFPPVHNPSTINNTDSPSTIPITVNLQQSTRNFGDDLPKQADNLTEPLDQNSGADTKSFWTLDYYQKFFDVDTGDVVERLLASVIPRKSSLLTTNIKRKPDLYGPFWISVTLIFTIAISGNIANYLQHANVHYQWKYDFHLVSYAATAIIVYTCIVPILFWIVLKQSANVIDLDDIDNALTSPLELICVYGYSLFIYIPVSILWTIQIGWLQWLLTLIAAFVSGSVLVYTLQPVLSVSSRKLFLMLGVFCCHLLLAAGFMLYFFHVPDSSFVPVNSFIPVVTEKNLTQKISN